MTNTQARPGKDLELRVHDGIVGTIILLSVIAGMKVDPLGFWLAGLTAAVMASSALTGFCPIHFILSKVMPAAD